MVRFLARYPLPEDEMVTPKGEPEKPEKPVRMCKAGKKCIKFGGRKPAPAKGSGDYSRTACGAADRVRDKRALRRSQQSNSRWLAPGNQHKQRLPEGMFWGQPYIRTRRTTHP